jgi:hypothetical protein
MVSLSTPDEQHVAFDRLIKLRWWRLNTDESEEQIATRRLGFESAEHMYRQLKDWGWPDWAVYKEPPSPPQPKRQPCQSGPTKDLPPASGATELFQEAIDLLTRTVEDLPHLTEVSHGGRFVGTYVYKDPVYFPRKSFSDEAWRKLCELHDHDPEAKGIFDTNAVTRNPVGAAPAPLQPLVVLIAAYALADRPLEPLLEALHPNPSEADIKGINRVLYARKRKGGDDRDGLLRTAQQLATLVRGGKMGKGAPPPDLPAREHNAACHITWRRDQGWSDEEIYQGLRHRGFTKEDISRLGNLQLRWPEA